MVERYLLANNIIDRVGVNIVNTLNVGSSVNSVLLYPEFSDRSNVQDRFSKNLNANGTNGANIANFCGFIRDIRSLAAFALNLFRFKKDWTITCTIFTHEPIILIKRLMQSCKVAKKRLNLGGLATLRDKIFANHKFRQN